MSNARPYCQKAADSLRQLIEELHADLDSSSKLRRKKGSLKVALKREKIEKYKKKLEEAISMLVISHQLYYGYVCQNIGDLTVQLDLPIDPVEFTTSGQVYTVPVR